MLASAYASLKNAPLIIKGYNDGINLDAVNVICVGSPTPKCNNTYTLSELRNTYAKETGTDKIIILNPNDLSIKAGGSIRTEKSGSTIRELYGKTSLAAPFLASAKHELILSTTSTSYSAVDAYIESEIGNIGIKPKYLTIVAMPRAIADTGSGFYTTVDWLYGATDDSNPFNKGILMGTGRIYGLTLSDVSAYISRSVFYDDLVSKIYGGSASGLSIGHSFASDLVEVKTISEKAKASGYDIACFVEGGFRLCSASTRPALSYYQHRQFTTFGNHGSCSSWVDTLSSSQMNTLWLDLDYVIADACLTLDFSGCESSLIGAHFIRQGAISYQGAVVVTPDAGAYDGPEFVGLKHLTTQSNLKLGDLNSIMKKEIPDSYRRDFMLIGDPTLEPRLKKVAW